MVLESFKIIVESFGMIVSEVCFFGFPIFCSFSQDIVLSISQRWKIAF